MGFFTNNVAGGRVGYTTKLYTTFILRQCSEKDGKRRLCVDYRQLNKKTIADKQPLPYKPDVIERLQGCRFFSKLDFASGYWQVAVQPDDIQKTAFVTIDGHYEWLVLPFGLKNAPATFQRVVRKILGDLIDYGVLSYLNDIVFYAKAMEEHNRLLTDVLKLLAEADVRLKREKCEYALNQKTKSLHHHQKSRRYLTSQLQKMLKKFNAFMGWRITYESTFPTFQSSQPRSQDSFERTYPSNGLMNKNKLLRHLRVSWLLNLIVAFTTQPINANFIAMPPLLG